MLKQDVYGGTVISKKDFEYVRNGEMIPDKLIDVVRSGAQKEYNGQYHKLLNEKITDKTKSDKKGSIVCIVFFSVIGVFFLLSAIPVIIFNPVYTIGHAVAVLLISIVLYRFIKKFKGLDDELEYHLSCIDNAANVAVYDYTIQDKYWYVDNRGETTSYYYFFDLGGYKIDIESKMYKQISIGEKMTAAVISEDKGDYFYLF